MLLFYSAQKQLPCLIWERLRTHQNTKARHTGRGGISITKRLRAVRYGSQMRARADPPPVISVGAIHNCFISVTPAPLTTTQIVC